MKKNFFPVFLCAALFAAPAAAQNTDMISDTGFYLDTVVTITVYGASDDSILQDCFSLISGYEQLFSRTREGSDVWNINHSQGAATEVQEETAELIRTALDYSSLSDGAFDLTIAPVVSLWDFQNNTGSLPLTDELFEALSHVDYETVSVDGVSVTLADPEAQIDLGGIAKGYIADRLGELLTKSGCTGALIDLGGNILTAGRKPDGTSWNIGIRKPFAEASELIAVVQNNGGSVVTSGTYERYFEKNGEIFHHILDPHTGYPADNGLTSVTILSDSSTQGDALSTACFVLGPEAGMELIEATDGVEALFVTEEETLLRSSGFPEEQP